MSPSFLHTLYQIPPLPVYPQSAANPPRGTNHEIHEGGGAGRRPESARALRISWSRALASTRRAARSTYMPAGNRHCPSAATPNSIPDSAAFVRRARQIRLRQASAFIKYKIQNPSDQRRINLADVVYMGLDSVSIVPNPSLNQQEEAWQPVSLS